MLAVNMLLYLAKIKLCGGSKFFHFRMLISDHWQLDMRFFSKLDYGLSQN